MWNVQARCGISRCSADASIAITSAIDMLWGPNFADHHRQGLRRVLEEPPEIGEWIVDGTSYATLASGIGCVT